VDPTVRPYESQLATVDRFLARLFEVARRRRAVIAVSSDHGSSLGDHGEETYGYFIYSATTHVPLVIAVPRLAGGRRIAPVVRTVDIPATVLDLVGLAPLGEDGRSLVPLMVGRGQDGPGSALLENIGIRSKYGMAPLFGVRAGPHLYVAAAHSELYDSEQDRGEVDELSGRLPRVAERLRADLARSNPGAVAPSELPDPRDRLDLYNRYRAAESMESRGERARAIDVYRSILSEQESFVFARRHLSEALLRENRMAEAEVELRYLVERRRATDTTFLNLALTRFRAKRPDEALAVIRAGLEPFPGSAALHHRAGRLLLQLQRPAEALTELDEADRLEPRFLDAQLGRAEALEALGRATEAKEAYQGVLRLGPESEEATAAHRGLERAASPRGRTR
jgi:tetratricopeptide (TPR) repeat protein